MIFLNKHKEAIPNIQFHHQLLTHGNHYIYDKELKPGSYMEFKTVPLYVVRGRLQRKTGVRMFGGGSEKVNG